MIDPRWLTVRLRYAKSFEDRFKQLDSFCHRLEALSTELAQSISSVNSLKRGVSTAEEQEGLSDELRQAARTLQLLPARAEDFFTTQDNSFQGFSVPLVDQLNDRSYANAHIDNDNTVHDDDASEDGDSGSDQSDLGNSAGASGSLVADSYGRLRYLGGATSNVLVEAVKGISPSTVPTIQTPGSSITIPNGVLSTTQTDLEMPMFVRGVRWPEMPYLPKPEDITRPPQYLADLLVNLYFDQLHYTFPVLYKPQFMFQYSQMMSNRSNIPIDKGFLSVFFAACACASSLLLAGGDTTKFPGLDYYQKALILHFASVGEASIERVQCLGLLAMCSGGWNTLTQSWTFAGQAVRAAQDLGMHLSSLVSEDIFPTTNGEAYSRRRLHLKNQQRLYQLDSCTVDQFANGATFRVTSMCLGRPMAADDDDCCCDIPQSLSDEALEACQQDGHPPQTPQEETSSPMMPFVAFAQLCRIGGRIQRLYSPSRIMRLRDPKNAKRFLHSVESLQKLLDKWLADLPDDIRFSANVPNHGPNLTMCVIIFIAHAGFLLNLYQLFSSNVSHAVLVSWGQEATSQCISAAQSCINAAELVHQVVPPSHLLAFCVHYLTLSGIVLMRIPGSPNGKALPDVEKCVKFLGELESISSGAKKGKVIIEHLLSQEHRMTRQEVATDFLDHSNFLWAQLLGSELFAYEGAAL
ncbi:hypothetical protein NM208_g2689 [Fusarium decemcellulare]|uniref:Uncharacterized protein n=2 Tax=Fusarium decemcellulare TaxID=57161 RepID=A0ACC1SB01_9HYPO|nr:hypothetical protein NM208_g6961 [Fusarium decemcellulare]KAJ3545084.1 hypothetical protein NM208_g2689 [Fusarium decemcellulare]